MGHCSHEHFKTTTSWKVRLPHRFLLATFRTADSIFGEGTQFLSYRYFSL